MKTKRGLVAVITIAVLAVGLSAGSAFAADSKDKLPKSQKSEKPTAPQKVEPPADSARGQTSSDRFIDKDNNGVDDRRETKVIRPENQPPPPTLKKQPEPGKTRTPTAKPPTGT
jgi:hypothetical protein